ncbi:MAG: hypothetical protein PHF74_02145 [Dehalococcoidales bacterium]|nr:hypothetical protein [Dehalococcoidales bacterium]
MKVSEYLFNEYKDLTTKYVSASQRLRELLPRFTALNQSGDVPNSTSSKNLIQELDKIEDDLEDAAYKVRCIKHTLVSLL